MLPPSFEGPLLNKLLNIFRIPELRNKMFFTIGMLIVYRIGFYVPLPGVNAIALAKNASDNAGSAARRPLQLSFHLFGRQPRPIDHLRLGHHALHFRLHHFAIDGHCRPRAGKAQEGRRAGDEKDHRMDAVSHRRRLFGAGGLVGLSAFEFADAAAVSARSWRFSSYLFRHGRCRPHRGFNVPDVAR